MKQTGATLIWATVTPVWEGEPGKRNADEEAFNAVAAKVMAGTTTSSMRAPVIDDSAGRKRCISE